MSLSSSTMEAGPSASLGLAAISSSQMGDLQAQWDSLFQKIRLKREEENIAHMFACARVLTHLSTHTYTRGGGAWDI